MAHVRKSRPDAGLGFQVKALKSLKVFSFHSEAASKMVSGEWAILAYIS
jgi:hypothetical protein